MSHATLDDLQREQQNEKDRVNDVLKRIEDILVEGKRPAAMLWSVLSALRGPDDLDDAQEYDNAGKVRCTIPIRRAAFPQVVAQAKHHQYAGAGLPGATFGSVGGEYPFDEDGSFITAGHHFSIHAKEAWNALRWLGRVPEDA